MSETDEVPEVDAIEKELRRARKFNDIRLAKELDEYDAASKLRRTGHAKIKSVLKEILLQSAKGEGDTRLFFEEAAKHGVDGVEAAYLLGAYSACHSHRSRSEGDLLVTEAMEEIDYERLKILAEARAHMEKVERMLRSGEGSNKPSLHEFLSAMAGHSGEAEPVVELPPSKQKPNEPQMHQ